MNWQQVCAHPALQNLPFKIELNERGQILMSPVKVKHSIYQGRINAFLAAQLKDGAVLVECAISTPKGTKVADVAWVSDQRLPDIVNEAECSIAPEVCVEVLSESNTDREIVEKRKLYFAQGAQEVWICDQEGAMHFYSAKSKFRPPDPRESGVRPFLNIQCLQPL